MPGTVFRASPTPAVMIQGAGSNVGKSLIVAGLCRLFANRGLTVRPFKPQNMSNNAAATPEGGEIGRAQALQALAARTQPTVDMNPVLLKPESETGSQIIVQGRRFGTMRAREFGKRKGELLPRVMESFERLCQDADIVIAEGAGSPAEVNLRAGDIANMGFAEAAGLPVILAGDIERGGVIASLVGTHAVLAANDRTRIKAFLINKFRGDTRLFDDGLTAITGHTGWPSLGVVPFFADAARLPAEDILDVDRSLPRNTDGNGRRIRIAVPLLPRIANFDDLDPLRLEPGVDVILVKRGEALPGNVDLVLLPGSKSTVADLEALRREGWDVDLAAHVRRGGHVLGLCGGYQLLGRTIADPQGLEGRPGTHEGLGYLDVETVLLPDKTVRPVNGLDRASRRAVSGYEIHLGKTTGPDTERAFLTIAGVPAGAASPDGRIRGTYVHGLFAEDGYRSAFLGELTGGFESDLGYGAAIDRILDDLAAHLAAHLDIARIEAIARCD